MRDLTSADLQPSQNVFERLTSYINILSCLALYLCVLKMFKKWDLREKLMRSTGLNGYHFVKSG